MKVKVEKTETGFSAYAEKYAAFTTAPTMAETISNMAEALTLYFEEAGKARAITVEDISYELEMTSIFEVFPEINVRALAARLGMNHTLLSQYASGKKKASVRQTEKILRGIRQFGRELTDLSLLA